jgi:hypothetical protein
LRKLRKYSERKKGEKNQSKVIVENGEKVENGDKENKKKYGERERRESKMQEQ